jgi:hypothetical protein
MSCPKNHSAATVNGPGRAVPTLELPVGDEGCYMSIEVWNQFGELADADLLYHPTVEKLCTEVCDT